MGPSNLRNVEKFPSLRFGQASSKQRPQLQGNKQKRTFHTKTHTDPHTHTPLTSPRALNRELFPQPFGPHTRTLVPDLTFREHRGEGRTIRFCSCDEGSRALTSKLRSLIRISPLGVASGVCSNLKNKVQAGG